MLTKTTTVVIGLIAISLTMPASADHRDRTSACVQTAKTMIRACHYDVEDDFYETIANCKNLATRQERKVCSREAYWARGEEHEFCGDVKEARIEACEILN